MRKETNNKDCQLISLDDKQASSVNPYKDQAPKLLRLWLLDVTECSMTKIQGVLMTASDNYVGICDKL